MIRPESATAIASNTRRGAQRDRRAVAIREGCRRPRPVTRDVSMFPEFRKHGSHPYGLRSMPSIKMLKRLWTYRRKRTEASFRGFGNSRNLEVAHHEHVSSSTHVFLPCGDHYSRATSTGLFSFYRSVPNSRCLQRRTAVSCRS